MYSWIDYCAGALFWLYLGVIGRLITLRFNIYVYCLERDDIDETILGVATGFIYLVSIGCFLLICQALKMLEAKKEDK